MSPLTHRIVRYRNVLSVCRAISHYDWLGFTNKKTMKKHWEGSALGSCSVIASCSVTEGYVRLETQKLLCLLVYYMDYFFQLYDTLRHIIPCMIYTQCALQSLCFITSGSWQTGVTYLTQLPSWTRAVSFVFTSVGGRLEKVVCQSKILCSCSAYVFSELQCQCNKNRTVKYPDTVLPCHCNVYGIMVSV